MAEGTAVENGQGQGGGPLWPPCGLGLSWSRRACHLRGDRSASFVYRTELGITCLSKRQWSRAIEKVGQGGWDTAGKGDRT